jgi:hypothetical protein
VGVALLYGLLHRDGDVRLFTAFLVGFGCLYQGLTMLPVMTHAIALTALPTVVVRVGVAAVLGFGAGVLAITLREQFADRTVASTTEPEAEPRGRDARPIRRPGTT